MATVTARNDTNSPFTLYDVDGEAVTFAAMGGTGTGDFVTHELASLQLMVLSGNVALGVPVNTVAPAITGTAQVGETLTASDGTWTGDTPTFTYQWNADGAAITDATEATYVPVEGDIDAEITVTVTATNSAGSASAMSEATDPVIDAV